MNIDFDEMIDALYIKLSDKLIETSQEVTPDIIVDLAEDGTAVGLDIQHVSMVSPADVANALVRYAQ